MTAPAFRSGGAAFHLRAGQGDILALRLTVANRMVGPAVIAPCVDDWIAPDGTVVRLALRIAPDYCYLQQGAEATLTLTAVVPPAMHQGLEYRSDLRFPGIDNEILPLRLFVEVGGQAKNGTIREHRISVALPLAGYSRDRGEREGKSREGTIYSLVAALAGMEVIPARWLAAEMLLSLCESGLAFEKKAENADLIYKLKRTRFHKNGALVFRGAQIPHWASISCTIASGLQSVVGNALRERRMIASWEGWLLSLAETDIERADPAAGQPAAPARLSSAGILEALGADSEKWFTAFILGLYSISARVRALVDALCARVSGPAEPRAPSPKRQRRKQADVLSERGSLQR